MWAQRDWPGQDGLKGEGVVVFPNNSGCVVEFLGAFCTDAHQYLMKEVAGNCRHKRGNPGRDAWRSP